MNANAFLEFRKHIVQSPKSWEKLCLETAARPKLLQLYAVNVVAFELVALTTGTMSATTSQSPSSKHL